eukprot:TRINITY_DN101922_c0_g1_i1.p1 TRINITY_DN101922_c0_g1~~TRINITY_DN101922_c0_g1_i1.p1  ORF type:complete len:894 (-),score=67.76 TRINITY_DN101922_c0_g1_i1:363-3044(-)
MYRAPPPPLLTEPLLCRTVTDAAAGPRYSVDGERLPSKAANRSKSVDLSSQADDMSPWRRPWTPSRPRGMSQYGHQIPTPLMQKEVKFRRLGMLCAPMGAAMEAFTVQHQPDCVRCRTELGVDEARWGTGLCDSCYSDCQKNCDVCDKLLTLKQITSDMTLCADCYKAYDKTCMLCKASLECGQQHWGTGLCDNCYDQCSKSCRKCSARLRRKQTHFASGLCDMCFHGKQQCRVCHTALEQQQNRLGTGLCDQCMNACAKDCRICKAPLLLGSAHYLTGLCETCHGSHDLNCKMCEKRLGRECLQAGHHLCGRCRDTYGSCCKMCQSTITVDKFRWGTGLCDDCYDKCEKTCGQCSTHIPFGQLHWGTGLCDSCYQMSEKVCRTCGSLLELGQLHYGTGLCDVCYDACDKKCRSCDARLELGREKRWAAHLCHRCYESQKKVAAEAERQGLSPAVLGTIFAQFVFYLAPGVMLPGLYVHIQNNDWGDAAQIYATVLTTASVVNMFAPIPLGFWAHHRGEREVYTGTALAGAVGGLACSFSPTWWLFALAWGILSAPPAIRGVRAAFHAKHVQPEDLSRAGQLASSAGLMGGFLGPLLASLLSIYLGTSSWLNSFEVGGCIAFISHISCSIYVAMVMPARRNAGKKPDALRPTAMSASNEHDVCERCTKDLSDMEKEYAMALCDKCYDSFSGTNYNFGRYRRDLLFSFCVIALSLEASMNAGVIATFQPIAVENFGWGTEAIGAVNFAGAGLSVVISLSLAQMRIPERSQSSVAAGLYTVSVLLFTCPPLQEWRAVLGLMLGLKAQILFMSPFTAVFSRLIGRVRVTNHLTTMLCLAPAIGGCVGTAMAPLMVGAAGTPRFLLAALPALLASIWLSLGWRRWDASEHRNSTVSV